MNGYYILAIVFIAVAAGLAVTYHSLRFLWEKNVRERGKGCLEKEVKLWRLKNRHFLKFLIAIIIISVVGFAFYFIGLGLDERAENELTKYSTRYDTMVGLLNNGDFYKYSGNEIARMCDECAEWKKSVNFKNDRYKRFSPYYAIKDNVNCAFVAKVEG